MRSPYRLIAGLIVMLSAGLSSAGIAPENVAIVVNEESESSKAIANEYVRLRGIPTTNVIPISGLSNVEQIHIDEFREKILGPVLKALEDRRLLPQIDVVSYSTEIPTAINVSSDIGPRKLPQIFTPTASINGLTFLHQLVMTKDVRYLDLNVNFYARRVVSSSTDTPWTPDEQKQYAEVVMKLQRHVQTIRQRKEPLSLTDEEKETEAALLKEVVAAFDALKSAHPQSSELHYNRACGLAQLDRADDAIAALKEAVKAGWWDHRHTSRDDDLKPLRERSDFKTLLEEMKTVDFDVQNAVGFRSSLGWLPNGMAVADERAPRYLLSTVLACTTGRGTTVDEALQSLRRSAAADATNPKGTVYFERNGDVRSTTREWAFRNAARKLKGLGVEAVVEDGVLPKGKSDVAGAVIGIADFDWSKSDSKILPGAIVEHLTSFGGVMTKGAGQTPLTEFIRNGASGSAGTVTEPYAIQAKFPSPFIHVHYASGCSLAESFYQSVTGPYQLLIVGDPLCQPWQKRFRISLEGVSESKELHGDVALKPRVESEDGITPTEFELYVDGLRIRSWTPSEELHWKTGEHADGKHELVVIARGNDSIQSVARHRLSVLIQNAGH